MVPVVHIEPQVYSCVDDLGCCGRLPWYAEIEAAASSNPSFRDGWKKHLDELCRRCSLSDAGPDRVTELLGFVAYARGLESGEGINHQWWEEVFRKRTLLW